MEDQDKKRLAQLLLRQKRRIRAPALLRAWEENGVGVTLLTDEDHEALVLWLRAHWSKSHQAVTDIGAHLAAICAAENLMIIMNVWDWDKAVAVLVPTEDLLRTQQGLRQIYPDGFLVADQRLRSGLLVDFDDHTASAEVSVIGPRQEA